MELEFRPRLAHSNEKLTAIGKMIQLHKSRSRTPTSLADNKLNRRHQQEWKSPANPDDIIIQAQQIIIGQIVTFVNNGAGLRRLRDVTFTNGWHQPNDFD